MKKVIAWLLVLALTAAISIGATLAYLTDTDEDVNVMTVGNVKIDQLEYERIDDETSNKDAQVQEFHDNKPLYPAVTENGFDYTPGDTYVDWTQISKDGYTSEIWNPENINNELDKMVFVKNKGTYDAYVRTVFAFEAGNYQTLDQFNAKMHLNLNETDWTWNWLEEPVTIGESTYFVATATYNKILEPGKLTEISLSQIALDSSATNADVEAFGETYNVLVKTQAIQADGFADPETALAEGFGAITVNAVPFDTDQPIQGSDVRTALHYLNADGKTKLTTKVSNVVFGLNKDHADVVDSYEGTLVTDGQDVEIYAYYVPNGSNYDVYFLGNADTCLPADSSSLFANMTALKSVNTASLNTGKATKMNNMFNSCTNLTGLDVTGWDTSNVTTMEAMFYNCKKITAVDASTWDTSKVENMKNIFAMCSQLTTVNTTSWNTQSVKSMESMFDTDPKLTEVIGIADWNTCNNKTIDYMFYGCQSLKTLDLSGWKTGNVTRMAMTFMYCTKLETVEGTENWDTSNVTFMYGMFFDNKSLKSLDVSTWKTGKVTNFASMFSTSSPNAGDIPIEELDVSGWNVSAATDLSYMFYGCGKLKKLDMSGWDVSKVTTTYHMFTDCHSLESLDFSGWNPVSLTNANGMFNDCRSVKVLDVSNFASANLKDCGQMFESCWSLETIIGLEKWNTAKVTNCYEMFTLTKLTELDLSAFDTSSVENTGRMFNSNAALKTIYVGDGWDMSKVTSSGDMFNGCASLTGANGTTIAGNPTDVTYARVDQPAVQDAEGNVITEAVPGYLTYKAPTETP